ncbi:SDR family NAD(P)-dependent oxidoreductase [Sphingomonas qilianensis]|uniref:SDR family oxidoreductase n=1 Tax=Sphingomonas qilianensis TaxID=1736690 RepID=A0ABU9XTR5_9SPHN
MLQQTTTQSRALYPSLQDKSVIITGGASGIGAGLVEAFVAQGARVGFVDIADGDGAALATRLADARHAPVYRRCDLTDLDQVAAVMADLEQALGGVDVLLNNAANDDRHTIDDVTPAFWEDRFNVNLRHQFFAAKAVIPAMKRAGGGAIVNFGSISWHLALPDLVLYQTCKAAIEGLTRALARDLGRSNIRVNTIVPGNVQTPRQERWYTPEGEAEIVAAQCLDGRIQPADVAALALFLASDDARMCTAHDYFVDAGWR